MKRAIIVLVVALFGACQVSGPVHNWEVTTTGQGGGNPRIGVFTSERWVSGGNLGAEGETCVLFFNAGYQRGVACGESITIRDLGLWKSDPSVWERAKEQR